MAGDLIDGARFEAVAGSTGLSAQNLAIAKAVLVDGQAQVDVSRDHGVTRQNVNRVVAAFRQHLALAPVGWVRLEIWAPPALAAATIEAAARALEAENASGR